MMVRIVSFDMDGTLIDSEFTDWVWGHGIPSLYAEKMAISFERARETVEAEYRRVGEEALEWYDIKYWFDFFGLEFPWKDLMERYVDKVRVYPDVRPVLERLKEEFDLVLVSNAGREFIQVELEATGLMDYFSRVFSATSDFRQVKKTADVYRKVCDILSVCPQEIVHVGDHYLFDFVAPKTIGINAFYLDRSASKKGDGVINHLWDLESRILSEQR